MKSMSDGSRGDDVKSLQRKLLEKGFKPGAIDGIFGPGTEAAVQAFQRSQGLLVDGIVGRRTAAALGFSDIELPPADEMPQITDSIVAKMAPGAPLDNIHTNRPPVLEALKQAGLTSTPIVLVAIATIRVETGSFEPISEFKSRLNTSPGGQPYDLYDFRRDLGNGAKGDGAKFKGRGFVQLTGRFNYQNFGREIGVDLISDPDRANDSQVAADLLAAFLKAKRIRIEQALLDGDFKDARRAVNGGTFGLDKFIASYQTGLRLLS